ncbi:hypothetical protein EV44_g1731 [Erysiphe necator]|uniref:Uncharacterized protein n=1 Tax=Uncinula necator TaxID=52586 RepID=A0A0B1P378_UNCNE|nr:hypothetical protein EV44_g1731 [Erysiphe necator]
MTPSPHDSCLLYRNKPSTIINDNTIPFGLSGLQTDDTLFLANLSFAKLEKDKMNFLCKKREKLTENHDLKFNGSLIRLEKGIINLLQKLQCDKITSAIDQNSYISQRARGAYVATMCQPEAAYDLSFAAQIRDPQTIDIERLNRRLAWQQNNTSRGLKFIPLDIGTLKLVVFTDSSFHSNPDYSSQLGYVIALVDGEGKANTIHWQSVKCKRVTKSVSASELYAISLGFDQGSALNFSINSILKLPKPIPLIICTDSRTIFDCLTRLNTVQEKRLMIDIMCLREAYEKREITEIKWIPGKSNPADALTKSKNVSQALQKLVETNWVDLESSKWVEREIKAN